VFDGTIETDTEESIASRDRRSSTSLWMVAGDRSPADSDQLSWASVGDAAAKRHATTAQRQERDSTRVRTTTGSEADLTKRLVRGIATCGYSSCFS
jgi:hypothetical protein